MLTTERIHMPKVAGSKRGRAGRFVYSATPRNEGIFEDTKKRYAATVGQPISNSVLVARAIDLLSSYLQRHPSGLEERKHLQRIMYGR
jgi:hypothetical protein